MALGFLAPALMIGGTLLGAFSQRDAGQQAQQQASVAASNDLAAAEYEAKQAEYLAKQTKAVSQREALEQRKSAALLASKALANAAASGAGASDPQMVDLISSIYAEGAYRSALALYEGEEEERSYLTGATARRLGGESAASARRSEGSSVARASNLSMFGTLIQGASSMTRFLG